MQLDRQARIERLHASPFRGVLAVTGGGSGAVSSLLQTPGASATVLEAVVPYAEASLADWLRGRSDSACSEPTARAMAVAAMQRTRQLEGVEEFDDLERSTNLFGVGCTASLASTRAKRGEHRVHVAVQTVEATRSWSLTLAKGARTRHEEEAVAAELVLHALAQAAGVTEADYDAAAGDKLVNRTKVAPPLWQNMLWGWDLTALVDPSANPEEYSAKPWCEQVLLPGSFNPPHAGHRQMLEVAASKLGKRVTLELSLTNVDKPRIDYVSLEERLAAIAKALPSVEVWLTRTPTFVEKSRQLRGCFVVGADTILRIADSRYYGGEEAARDEAIATLAERGCQFLVFGRFNGERFQTLDELSLPPALRAICEGVSAAEFREDISSTELRNPPGA